MGKARQGDRADAAGTPAAPEHRLVMTIDVGPSIDPLVGVVGLDGKVVGECRVFYPEDGDKRPWIRLSVPAERALARARRSKKDW